MKFDEPITNRDEILKELLECETEGQTIPPPLEAIAEVEKLYAADLIMIMRNIRERSQAWPEITREQFAKRFESLSLEAAAATAWLRRHRASDEVPQWLTEGAPMLTRKQAW